MCPRFDSWWHHRKGFFIYEEVFFCHLRQFVAGRAKDWILEFLALRPRVNSWWHHRKDFFIYEEVFLFYISRLVLIEQRAGGSEFLALRPRFDSWWHHRKDFFIYEEVFFVLVEQRTGFLNSCPCVPGSIPGGTTEKTSCVKAAAPQSFPDSGGKSRCSRPYGM